MSLSTGFTWTHKNIKLLGYSMAGISTSIVFPEADVCFDVAQGLPYQLPVNTLLITHGHLDHASGIPYLIGQKAMTGQLPPVFYMPQALVQPMRQMMKIWSEIEAHTYQFRFQAIAPGEEAPLKAPYFFRPFTTEHRVPSQGYTVFLKKKSLKVQFRGLEPDELGRLRREGADLDEFTDEPVISFTGDTKIEFLKNPTVAQSRVLIMEVTYWDGKKSVANAREWGHIHFDEFLQQLPSIKSEKILLIHASARYSTRELLKIMDERVPEHFKDRVELFPRPS